VSNRHLAHVAHVHFPSCRTCRFDTSLSGSRGLFGPFSSCRTCRFDTSLSGSRGLFVTFPRVLTCRIRHAAHVGGLNGPRGLAHVAHVGRPIRPRSLAHVAHVGRPIRPRSLAHVAHVGTRLIRPRSLAHVAHVGALREARFPSWPGSRGTRGGARAHEPSFSGSRGARDLKSPPPHHLHLLSFTRVFYVHMRHNQYLTAVPSDLRHSELPNDIYQPPGGAIFEENRCCRASRAPQNVCDQCHDSGLGGVFGSLPLDKMILICKNHFASRPAALCFDKIMLMCSRAKRAVERRQRHTAAQTSGRLVGCWQAGMVKVEAVRPIDAPAGCVDGAFDGLA
jgi:hypothetical protein